MSTIVLEKIEFETRYRWGVLFNMISLVNYGTISGFGVQPVLLRTIQRVHVRIIDSNTLAATSIACLDTEYPMCGAVRV